jgi:hypothetical protein
VLWVVVFLVIALAGLAMLVGYAVWLAHKTADLFSELGVLGKLGGDLAVLLAEIRAPGTSSSEQTAPKPLIVRAADAP